MLTASEARETSKGPAGGSAMKDPWPAPAKVWEIWTGTERHVVPPESARKLERWDPESLEAATLLMIAAEELVRRIAR